MEFANNSLNSPKIRKLNIDTLIIPQGLLIHEKNQSSKISCNCPFNFTFFLGIGVTLTFIEVLYYMWWQSITSNVLATWKFLQ